jgi:outer membrane lipoprotein SlyB
LASFAIRKENDAMETPKRTLHPLLTAAAVSVIIFSAVGVAAVTGLIPTSKGSPTADTPVASLEAPAPAPAPAPAEEAKPAPERHAAPAAKPVHKPVAKAHKPKPATHVAYAETPTLTPPPPPVVAQAPVETPKPVIKPGRLGTVEAVREVTQNGSANGIGAVAGGAVGGVLGHQLKHDSNLVTLVGAAAGAFIGNEAQKRQNASKHWELTVRLDDGSTQTIRSEAAPFWHQGDRVRLLDGKLQPV